MFSEREKDYIINYKYHGGDLSPIYKHVLSPLAENSVHYFIPDWMAPNVITFLGLIMSFISFGATMIYNPSLEPGAPRWLHFLTGLCILLYQTLDNMDGKQARKTGSSSALGMFFDHACDAINAGITVISMGSVLGTGWSGRLFTCYASTFFPFFFQTWEEYYTGSMLLPPFNGPTEGLLMAVGVCFLAYSVGSETFHTVRNRKINMSVNHKFDYCIRDYFNYHMKYCHQKIL
jgi:ethanolaminephosphotransferase